MPSPSNQIRLYHQILYESKSPFHYGLSTTNPLSIPEEQPDRPLHEGGALNLSEEQLDHYPELDLRARVKTHSIHQKNLEPEFPTLEQSANSLPAKSPRSSKCTPWAKKTAGLGSPRTAGY